jgi:hypothetical protein
MAGSEPLLIKVKTRLFVPVGGGRDEVEETKPVAIGWKPMAGTVLTKYHFSL